MADDRLPFAFTHNKTLRDRDSSFMLRSQIVMEGSAKRQTSEGSLPVSGAISLGTILQTSNRSDSTDKASTFQHVQLVYRTYILFMFMFLYFVE